MTEPSKYGARTYIEVRGELEALRVTRRDESAREEETKRAAAALAASKYAYALKGLKDETLALVVETDAGCLSPEVAELLRRFKHLHGIEE